MQPSASEGALSLRSLRLTAALILSVAAPAAAQEMPQVDCDRLHFRIVGEEYERTCRAMERQGDEGRWRQEHIVAEGMTGIYAVSRAIPVSGHGYMLPVSPRSAAERAGLRDIEDWGEQMRIEGYRAHGFTARPPEGRDRLRCLAFVRNPAPTGGAQIQIVGVYCTLPGAAMDKAAAAQVLERIEAN